jgi:PAS domain S-box-containing protein
MEWLRLIGARLSIGLLFTILILTFWVIHLHHQRQVEMRRAVEHATEVSSSLEAVLSALKDAEIGERGYLITGQPEYLEAYRSAARQLRKLITRFESRIGADPVRLRQLRDIEPLVFARLAELQEAIDARRERGFGAAETIVRANALKGTMPAVRARIAEAARENRAHLREHLAPTLGLGAMLGTAAVSGVIAFSLTSAGFLLGRRKDELEEAIRENEALLRTVLAQMPSGVVIADAAGRLLLGNAQMERIWRQPFHPAATIADYQVYRGYHPDRRPYGPEEWPLARSLHQGETVQGELLYFLRGDNTCGAMEISSAPIRDRSGKIIAGVATFHDVSQRHEIERELRRSRRAFKSLVEHLPDVVFRLDPALRHTYMSPVVVQYTGIESGEYLGKTVCELGFDLVHCEALEALCREVLASGGERRFEFTDRGRQHRCRLVAEPGANGSPEAILGICEDITAQKLAERALTESEERLRLAQRAGNSGVWDWDMASGRLYWSDEAFRLFGLEPGAFEPTGESWLDLVHPDDRRRVRERVTAGLGQRRELFDAEYRIVRPDGSVCWVEDRGQIFYDREGRPIRMLGINIDITERRRAMERLRLGEERLAMAQEAGGVGIFDWDPTTGEVFWSPQLEAIFGLAPGGFGGRHEHWAKQVHPDDLPRLEQLFQALLRGESEEAGWEYRIFRADGELRWISARGRAVFEPSGHPVRIIGINIDITQRKLAEQALREADRRKDEFLAMLAHELRNPLAPIRNAIEVLRRVRAADPKQVWAREVLERQVGQLIRLVDDLLDVSRITRGKITLKQESLDLREIVDQAVEISHPLFLARGHVLSVAVPDEPLPVRGDRTRLVQITSNLLNNAAKYTPDNGRIEVELRAAPGEAILRVSDNGTGIAPELLPHVFEPFRQADETLARSQGGLGVGLTLVQRLVRLHGGRVEVHSEGPGRGAVFTVVLPRVG